MWLTPDLLIPRLKISIVTLTLNLVDLLEHSSLLKTHFHAQLPLYTKHIMSSHGAPGPNFLFSTSVPSSTRVHRSHHISSTPLIPQFNFFKNLQIIWPNMCNYFMEWWCSPNSRCDWYNLTVSSRLYHQQGLYEIFHIRFWVFFYLCVAYNFKLLYAKTNI
jgi:hypothetical protein